MKKLCKSNTNKVISGVCGGIAEYFNIDPTIVRVIWALFTLFSAFMGGIIFYIVCAIVMPNAYGSDPAGDVIDHSPQSN